MKISTRSVASSLVVLLVLGLAASSAERAAAQPSSSSVACDQECLSKVMTDFLSAMTTGKPGSVPLADQAEVRENTRIITLDASTWRQVKAVRSTMIFGDPVTGNVVSRAGVELRDGKPDYISTRLKVVAGGRITDVEIAADTSARVVGSYVWNLDPQFTAVLPPDQRMRPCRARGAGPAGLPWPLDTPACRRRLRRCHVQPIPQRSAGDQRWPEHRRRGTGEIVRVVERGRPPLGAGERAAPVSRRPGARPRLRHHAAALPEEPGPTGHVRLGVVQGGGRRNPVKIDNIGLMIPGVTTLGFIH